MKRFYILFLLVAFSFAASAQQRIKDCASIYRPDIILAGTVKVITKGTPTFRVRVIPENSKDFASMDVKLVKKASNQLSSCGRWHLIKEDSKEQYSFTVRWVDKEEDFTIRFVKEWPGSL
ncbi:MAG: hypothetical protein LBQ31_10985 [Bacteroidales bacterium]|jgi:hypothetical protein|nr:hypothetical protein [Bacteroidales bacterium]